MSKRFPVASARKCIKALRRHGFEVRRQTGSHIVLRKRDPPRWVVVVPDHKEIDRGTMRSILEQAHLTRQEFLDALR